MPKIRKNKKQSTPKTVGRGTAQAFSRSRKNSPAGEASAKLKKELGYGAKTRDKARGTEHRGAGKEDGKLLDFKKMFAVARKLQAPKSGSAVAKTAATTKTVAKPAMKGPQGKPPAPKPTPKPSPKPKAKKQPKPVEKKRGKRK